MQIANKKPRASSLTAISGQQKVSPATKCQGGVSRPYGQIVIYELPEKSGFILNYFCQCVSHK